MRPIVPKFNQNMSPAVVRAVRSLPKKGGVVRFAPGEYHFYPEGTQAEYCAVSNNAFGEKRGVFVLKDLEDVTIDGGGSRFVLHGEISPWILKNCRKVRLKNFSVDYAYPFHIEGRVRDAGEHWFDLEIDTQKYPYFVRDGVLRMQTPEWTSSAEVVSLITEFDPVRQSMACNHCFYCYRGGKFTGKEGVFECKALADGLVRVKMFTYAPPCVGNIMTFVLSARECSVIFAQDCRDLALKKIDIHAASGMGVICQTSENIFLQDVRVISNGQRTLSTEADATHFVNCSGSLRIHRCIFENMDDDAVNLHGVYLPVKTKTENILDCEYRHGNIGAFREGDAIRLLCAGTLQEVARAKILRVCDQTEREVKLVLDRTVPGGGDCVVENLTRRFSYVHIWQCVTGKNRPRGFLVTSGGKVVLENNLFYHANCGVEMAGDADFWFESGAVDEVIIRNNLFRDCGHAYDVAAINICPHVGGSSAAYHGRVKIYGNVFQSFNPWIVHAQNVEKLQIYDNRYLPTDHYPYIYRHRSIEAHHCGLETRGNIDFRE